MSRFSAFAFCAAQNIAGQHLSSGSFDNVAMLQSLTSSSSNRVISDSDHTVLAHSSSRGRSSLKEEPWPDFYTMFPANHPVPSAPTQLLRSSRLGVQVEVEANAKVEVEVEATAKPTYPPTVHHDLVDFNDRRVPDSHSTLSAQKIRPSKIAYVPNFVNLLLAKDEAPTAADTDVDADGPKLVATNIEVEDGTSQDASTRLDTSAQDRSSNTDDEGSDVIYDYKTKVDIDSDAEIGVAVLATTDGEVDAGVTADAISGLHSDIETSSSEESGEENGIAYQKSPYEDNGVDNKVNTEVLVTRDAESDVVEESSRHGNDEGRSMAADDEAELAIDSEGGGIANDNGAKADIGADAEGDKAILVTVDTEGDAAVAEDTGMGLDASTEEVSSNADGEGSDIAYDDGAKPDIQADAEADTAILVTADTETEGAVAEDLGTGLDASTEEVSSDSDDGEGIDIAYNKDAKADIRDDAEVDTVNLVATGAEADAVVAEDAGAGLDASVEDLSINSDWEGGDIVHDDSTEVDDDADAQDDEAILVTSDAEGDAAVTEEVGISLDASAEEMSSNLDGDVYDDSEGVDIGADVEVDEAILATTDAQVEAAVAEDAGASLGASADEMSSEGDGEGVDVAYDDTAEVDVAADAEVDKSILQTAGAEAETAVSEDGADGLDSSAEEMSSNFDSEESEVTHDDSTEVDSDVDAPAEVDAAILTTTNTEAQVVVAEDASTGRDASATEANGNSDDKGMSIAYDSTVREQDKEAGQPRSLLRMRPALRTKVDISADAAVDALRQNLAHAVSTEDANVAVHANTEGSDDKDDVELSDDETDNNFAEVEIGANAEVGAAVLVTRDVGVDAAVAGLDASIEKMESNADGKASSVAYDDSTEFNIDVDAQVVAEDSGNELDASAEEAASNIAYDDSVEADISADVEVDKAILVTADAEVDASVAEDAGIRLDTSIEEVSSDSDGEGSGIANDDGAKADSGADAEGDKTILVTADTEGDAAVAEDTGMGLDASTEEVSSDAVVEGSDIAYDGTKPDIQADAEADKVTLVTTDDAADASVAEDAGDGLDASAEETSSEVDEEGGGVAYDETAEVGVGADVEVNTAVLATMVAEGEDATAEKAHAGFEAGAERSSSFDDEESSVPYEVHVGADAEADAAFFVSSETEADAAAMEDASDAVYEELEEDDDDDA